MSEILIKNQHIICPVCGGNGKAKSGFGCSNCRAMGLGVFFKGYFYYWGPKFNRMVIELRNVRKKVHILINLLAYGTGLAGLLALGVWIYLASSRTIELGAFAFWREQHPLILIFWISVFADMFVIYRISEEERKFHQIKSSQYYENKQRT